MSVVTIYMVENLAGTENVVSRLDKKKVNGCWISAQASKYADNEVFIQYWYNESIEYGIKRAFSEHEAGGIYSFLKENGRTMVLKRIYCFINLITRTLEIYRGKDGKTEEIVTVFEKLLETKIFPISLRPEDLQRLYETHAADLTMSVWIKPADDGKAHSILNLQFHNFSKEHTLLMLRLMVKVYTNRQYLPPQ